MGVQIVLNTPVGGDLTLDKLRGEGYKAFFLGIGAWAGIKLGIEGESEYPQVVSALQFLKDVSLGMKIKPSDRVAVVGGGNAAVDAARTCVRLGSSSVSVVYRRTRSEMPAHFEEIIQMAEEGIHVHQLTIPARVHGSYCKVDSLECLMATLGEPDESGRRRPVPIEGSEYKKTVGAVIAAIGQQPNLIEYPGLGPVELTKKGAIHVHAPSQQTNLPDVFAGGDAVTGPATVVQAIGAGKRAAMAIHAFLRGLPMPKRFVPRPHAMVEPILMTYQEKAFIQRQENPIIDLDRRLHTFDRVERGLDEASAKLEAARCMRCDICERCGKCVEICRDKIGVAAIGFHHAGESSLILKDYVHGLPHCIGCGSCVNICPTGALQMEDHEDERVLFMSGTIVNRVKLQPCGKCGQRFAPMGLIRNVGTILVTAGYDNYKDLCPDCRREMFLEKVQGPNVAAG
jgi:thioredoxin reductase/ferredoxin